MMPLTGYKTYHAQTRQKIRKRLLFFIASAMQLSTNFTAKAADCYPKSENLLPHVFMAVDSAGNPTDTYNRFHSIAGWLDPTDSDDFIVYGGASADSEFTSISANTAVVVRMDLTENKIRWARHYKVQGSNNLLVNNLAIKPDGQQIVVHAQPEQAWTKGDTQSTIFVIRAKDGGHETKMAHTITHDNAAKFLMRTQSSMQFTSYGTVLMTWSISYFYAAEVNRNLMECDDGFACDSRLRIASFDVSSEQVTFYLEQDKHFGQSTAIAYGHWGQGADSNIYLGGAADDSRYNQKSDAQNWAPALYNLNSDGLKKELWKMKIEGNFQTSNEDHAVIDHMKLDKSGASHYLFGTTRKHTYTDWRQVGSMIYCWRVELTSDHRIDDGQSPLIRRLDAPLGASSNLYTTWVTGISESLQDSSKKFDLIIQGNSDSNVSATRELWYVKIDFDSSSASALRLYEQADEPYSWQSIFVNTQDGSNGSYHNVQRSYTISRSRSWTDGYGSHSYTQGKGLILPSLWAETCLDTALNFIETDFQLIESTGNTLLKSNEEEFTTSMRTSPIIVPQSYYMMDVNQSKMYPTSYCTAFTVPVNSADITPGFITDTTSLGKCGLQFDENEYEIPFTKPVISSPTCDDDSHVWAAWIEPLDAINTNDYDSSKFKVAIDMTDSKIKITGHLGKNHALDAVNFRANFMLPDGITTSFDFVVGTASPSSCDKQPLNLPALSIVNQSYQLGQTANSYTIGFFTTSNLACTGIPINYSSSVKADFALVPSLSTFLNPTSMGAQWYLTNDVQYVGTYTVTITATQGCSTAQASFTLTVHSFDCTTDTFTLSSTKFTSPALTYDIRAPMATFAWTDSDVTTFGNAAQCGNLKWEITLSDGFSPIDSTIFGYTAGEQSITTYSELIGKAGQYQTQVTVYWQTYGQTSGVKLFRIDLVDSCDTSVVVIPPAITNPSLYLIGQPPVVFNFGAFDVSPTYCVMSTNYNFNPSPPDSNAIKVNLSTKTVTIDSTDLATGRDASNNSPATYTLKVFQVTEGGTGQYGSEMIEYTITIGDPCKTSAIVIDSAFYNPPGLQSYTIGAAEQTITVDQSKISNGVTPLGICPEYTFQLYNNDGTNVDLNVFTFETTGISPLIKLQTSDHSRGPTFDVLVRISYNDAVYSQSTDSTTITINILNPCESATLTLDSSPFFSDATYTVGSPTALEADFSSGLHSTTTTPQISCGDYFVVFQHRDATNPSYIGAWQESTSPFSVDQSNKKLLMSTTTDPNQIGQVYELRYQVALVDYPLQKTSFDQSPTFRISLIDACSSGVTLAAPVITNPPEYKYTGSPGIQVEIPLFTVSPSDCPVTYTCTTVSGPSASNDLCAISDGFTVSSFQVLATKLFWSFASTQTDRQPNSQKAGNYVIKISGVAGTGGQATDFTTFTFVLTDPCPNAVITHNMNPFVAETYNIVDPPMVQTWNQTIATADTDPANCGNYVISIWIHDGSSDINFENIRPGYFVIDGSAQTVTSPGPTQIALVLPNTQTFKYKVFLQDYYPEYSVPITAISQWPTVLTVTDTCGSPMITDPGLTSYDLGVYAYTGVAMSYTFSNFAVIPIECPVTHTCSSTGPAGAPDICPAAGISNSLTSSTWDALLGTLTFLTTDVKTSNGGTYPAGTYTLSIVGTVGRNQDKSAQMDYTVTLTDPQTEKLVDKTESFTIINNFEPEFIEPLQTMTQFELPAMNGTVQQPYSTRQKIGKLADYERDSFIVKFIGTDDYDFLTPVFDRDGNLFIDLSYLDTSLAQSGNYSLYVEVTETVNDTQLPSIRYPFSVQVLTNADSQEQKQKEQTDIVVDQVDDQPEVSAEVQAFEPPTMKMANTDKFGLVEIVFSERMLVPSDWQSLNETHLDVQLEAFDEEMQVLMDFDWNVTSFSSERMMIQFTFKNPKQISMNVKGKDILSIDVITLNKFTAEKSMLTVQDITQITIKVPKQERREDKELIESIEAQAQTVNQGTSTIIGSSFVLNIFLASSLSLLWGLINSMQLVTHFPMLNYRWPYSASIIFGQLYELATFDLIPTDWAEDKISEEVGLADKSETNFDAEAHLSDGIIEAGYDSSNVMLNSILQITMIAAGIVAGILLLLLRVFFYKVKFIKRALLKLQRAIFWNFFIRLILESYLELAMNNWIRVLVSDNSTWWERTSSGFAFSLLTIMTLMGLLTPVFLHCKLDKLKSEDFKSKYGALTEQLRVEDSSMRCYQMFFMLRRLTFAMMIIFMPQTPWAQTQLLCLQCTMHVIYAGVRPFYLPYMNRLELTNEYLVLTSSYFLFIYSDAFLMEQRMGVQVKQEEMQERVGMAQVVLLGIQVAINLTVMMVVQVYVIYRKIKLCFLKKTHKKHMKEYERRRKLKNELLQGPVDDGDPSEILPNGQRVQVESKLKTRQDINKNSQIQQLEAIPEEDQVKEYSSRNNDMSELQQLRNQDKLLVSQQQLQNFSSSSSGSDGLILNDAFRDQSKQWQRNLSNLSGQQPRFRPNQSNTGFARPGQNRAQFRQDNIPIRFTDTADPLTYLNAQNIQINTMQRPSEFSLTQNDRGQYGRDNTDFLQTTMLRNRSEYFDGPVHAPTQIPTKKFSYVKPELLISQHYPNVDGPLSSANDQSYFDIMKSAYGELLKQAQNEQNK